MKYDEAKKMIPLYLEGELQPQESQEVKEILAKDPTLRAYADQIQQSWDLLGDLEEIQPSDNFVSEFWTRLATQKPWYQRLIEGLRFWLYNKKLVSALATICVILIIGIIARKTNTQVMGPQAKQLAELSSEELEIIENIELAENLDILEDFDLLEDMEIIEDLEEFEISYAA